MNEHESHLETSVKQPVEFNGRSFTISALSLSPEGFEFRTRESIRRRPDYYLTRQKGISEEDTPGLLGDKQRTRLQSAVKREIGFQGAGDFLKAKGAWQEAKRELSEAKNNNADPETIDRLTEKVSATWEERRKFAESPDRERYVRGMPGKIGIRNLQQEGNILAADAKFVSYPVYNEFSSPQNSREVLDWSSLVGTAMIVRSADGRIVVQHRAIEKRRLHEEKMTRGNASYTDIPGASVAGLVDVSLKSPDRIKGTPDPVDTDSVKAGILKEAGEELGLGADDLEKVRIVGIAHDNVKIHDEILLLADSKLTSEQIRETSRTSNRNKNLGDADFEEKFVDIEATPEAIQVLLTQVRCPLPPTHAAALVAAGYSLVLQDHGIEAADSWKAQLEQGVQENYREMDEMVKAYFDKHPETLTQVPERFWGKNVPVRNLHGYTPAYGPEEQGLPSFEDEMVRTALIPETRRHVENAYLFDVDGVLSDPREKRVTEEGIYTRVIERLQRGEPVGLNTGRSTEWMEERIIRPLLEKLQDKSVLANFVAIGEKGGTWITFDEKGNMYHGRAQAISVPQDLNERVRQLVEEKYGDSMFFDATKETMISIEMKDGYKVEEFAKRQAELEGELAQILAETGQENTYKIDPTTIATDIESPHVGKALGADRFLQFLKDQDIKPARFIAFGDSRSDLEMADELERKQKSVEFVYVGDRAKLGNPQKGYPIEYIEGFSQGTLAYLLR